MKHRLPIPFFDDEPPDVARFVRQHGWEIRSYEFVGMRVFQYGGGELKYLRITIVPQPTSIAAGDIQMVVTSGSTLVYDDVEGTMGVTLRPEPQDAVPADVRPADKEVRP